MTCAACLSKAPVGARFCPGCGGSLGSPARTRAPAVPVLEREELDAALAARRDLGTGMEGEVVEAFLDRIEQSLDRRIEARVQQRLSSARRLGRSTWGFTARIGVSMFIATGASAVIGDRAGSDSGGTIVAVWIATAVMNIYYTEVERRRE